MTSLAAKIESDPLLRARTIKLLSRAMGVTMAAAIVVLGCLGWAIL